MKWQTTLFNKMVRIVINRATKAAIVKKIVLFYIGIWYDRLVNLTLKKYAFPKARKNIVSALAFLRKTFDDNQVKKTTYASWQARGWNEIQYSNWHFAVIVQLDMFGNHIAIVQDCVHNKDYHNDTSQTSPFVMDNPDDKSHLVDWKEYRMNNIIIETINQYLKQNLILN